MYKYEHEQIEWSNVWREDADQPGKPRILLIGDSITQGYCSYVYNALDKKWGVTMYATSKGIDNPFLLEEIFLLAKQENNNYEYVHFNNGIHARYITDEDYRSYYQQAILALCDRFPKAKLGFATSTTLCAMKDNEMVLSEANDRIIRRNAIVRSIAGSNKIDDLYEVSARDNNYHCADCTHFTKEGYQILGTHVAEFLMSL